MLVKEGYAIEANQPLLRIDDTAAKAKLRRLVLRKYRLLGTFARLQAEIHSSPTLIIPPVLRDDESDPIVISVIRSQENELKAWRASLLAQEEVFRKEIAGLQESIQGYQAQMASNEARVRLFEEEITTKNELLHQQLIRKSEVLALQRSKVGLSGELGDLAGRIGDAKERSARAEQQIVQLRSAAIQKATEELRSTESDLDDVQEQILAAQDVLQRTEVRAPVRGIVVKLNHHTPGGVVAPGGSSSNCCRSTMSSSSKRA
jgi:HlyD family type I secretion membrane fusion protein